MESSRGPSKGQIVRALIETADLEEVVSDNPFRSRAFRAAARTIDAWSGDFARAVESGELTSIQGIGKGIADFVTEMWTTGASARHEELRELVPPGVRRMLDVPGLGPKKVRTLWRELKIESIDALKEACSEGRVAKLKGFGKKTAENILAGIGYLESVGGRYLLPEAEAVASQICEYLRSGPPIEKLEVAGSLRRRRETVRDLDVLAVTSDPQALSDHFIHFTEVETVIAQGDTKTSVRLVNGMAVDLRIVKRSQFPFALVYFTGSKEHNVRLRSRAKDRGLKLNEYGLFPDGSARSKRCADEKAIYRALDLDWIPPELREDLGEIEAAEQGAVPRLLEAREIQGIVHAHTTWSDGKATLEDLARAVKAAGYSYLGISDHSQSAFYAGGLDPDRVRAQHEEIDRLSEELEGFRIFKGIESDIRADGSLDYSDDVLESFDFVIASLHSHFHLPEEEQTARVLRALESPYTTILGHATTRLLLRREGVELDLDRVLVRAAELGVAIEINANPYRLDIDWRYGPRARELGVYTSINPDAHSLPEIGYVRFGVDMARKAGWPP
ncbi:MAG TPA: DNA polymerase/3'-5' exonuclease PolX, partial [Planctomycetota bacterium]|nr:DNA polymerase/3'-5' exonuclease PolX [Planctomycetota bacterium]